MKHVLLLSVLLSGCAVSQETTPAEVDIDSAVVKSQASALSAAVASAQADDGDAVSLSMAKIGDVAAALVPEGKGGARERVREVAQKTSGTLTWVDGKITCTGAKWTDGTSSVTVDCSLTYATGRVAGTVHTTGTAVVGGARYAWNVTIDATDVTFTKTAFTGGSASVDAKVSVNDTVYEGSATIALP